MGARSSLRVLIQTHTVKKGPKLDFCSRGNFWSNQRGSKGNSPTGTGVGGPETQETWGCVLAAGVAQSRMACWGQVAARAITTCSEICPGLGAAGQ